MGSGRNALWTPPGDMCLQVGRPGGAEHHLCSVSWGASLSLIMEETPDEPQGQSSLEKQNIRRQSM